MKEKTERNPKGAGRPLIGAEPRVTITLRVKPQTRAKLRALKAKQVNISLALDRFVESL